jgi:ATP-dependent RNA helicase DeaD
MPFPTTFPPLERALAARGYAEPTPVQAAVLGVERAGERGADLLVSAQTGSGKTVAFGLAMGADLLEPGAETLPPAGAPLALVVAPTRELAQQVAAELTWLWAEAGARVATCVGGMDPRAEHRRLQAGAHIVVGTPGRLCDHLERGNLDLSAVRVVVLDEADEMLDLGFREELEEILDAAPEGRRTLLFSATLARDIVALAKKYQTDAVRIDAGGRDEPHGDIEYRAIRIAPNEVERAVVNVLRWYEAPGALVFCSTREATRRLHVALRERGFGVVALSGELTQKERTEALQALRDGRARVCVATDVAARGLDLPDLGLVIHADLPVNKAGLLHRSGRTGRAGRKGVSVVMVPHTRRRKAEQLLSSAHVEAVWASPPTADEIRERDRQRFVEDPILNDPASEEELALARAVVEARSAEQIAVALVRMRRNTLPDPEELYADGGGETVQAREERGPLRDRLAPDEVEWFRLPVGRAKNADPKWLIPLICRLGHVTKKEIGSIRIFDRETKFEIARTHSARFAEAVRNADANDVQIEPSSPPGERSERSDRGERPSGPRERGGAGRRDHKPFARKRDGDDAPAGESRPFEKKPRWERKERDEGPAPQPEKRPYDRKPRAERTERAERSERPERAERPERKPYDPLAADHAPARKPRAERPERPDRAEPAGRAPWAKDSGFKARPKSPKGPKAGPAKHKRKDNAGGKKPKAW